MNSAADTELSAEVVAAAVDRFRRARQEDGKSERIDDPDALAILASALQSVEKIA